VVCTGSVGRFSAVGICGEGRGGEEGGEINCGFVRAV
jgi:hypothetical protein